MAKRRRARAIRSRSHELDAALARAAGIVQDQLELALVQPRFARPQACSQCGRWGYHLATCPVGRAEARR